MQWSSLQNTRSWSFISFFLLIIVVINLLCFPSAKVLIFLLCFLLVTSWMHWLSASVEYNGLLQSIILSSTKLGSYISLLVMILLHILLSYCVFLLSLYWSCVGRLQRIIKMIFGVCCGLTWWPSTIAWHLIINLNSYLKIGASLVFSGESSLLSFLYESGNLGRFPYCSSRNFIVLWHPYSGASLIKSLINTRTF